MNRKRKGPAANAAGENKRPLLVSIRYYKGFYLMFLPVLIFAIVFHYLPMLGIRYAFFSYKGIKEPVFVGLAHFEKMMNMPGFWSAFGNTITLSIIKLLLNTAMAVVLSLMLNEIRSLAFKKAAQTIVYLPHFMSWVVTASVFTLILSPTNAGLINSILVKLGIVNEGIYFLGDQNWWRPMFYTINVWKDTGWGTIIFIATLSGINPELYEAASMDGANRWNRLRYITMPALNNTIITVLILNLAKVMNLFESVFVMQNDAVIKKADVLQTYIYTQTFNSGALPDYGYTTAVGLTSSLVGCFLVLICNKASHKVRGRGIV
ncbi:ABC transporter permease [Lacrimispora sp.]|uniref:ABC transporter permease n=1 Tax=Lacrimispora sp. TaxID=2719234 RepID=UPI003991BBB3